MLFNYHTAFAYTGLAELPRSKRVADVRGGGLRRIPTNIWLAEVLSLSDNPEACLGDLAQEATKSMNQLSPIADIGQANSLRHLPPR